MSTRSPIAGPWAPNRHLGRRETLKWVTTLGAGAAAVWASSGCAAESSPPGSAPPSDLKCATRAYPFKKSINLWAFPYPQRMDLRTCLQLAHDAGFEGIELNFDLENDLSPRATAADYQAIRRMADEIGIAISGLCSFLFWPYPLTSNDPVKRQRGLELATAMTQAAHDLEVENLLVVPGAVHIPWRDDHEPVPNDVCDQRARAAIGSLLPTAEKLGVYLNIENIFFNGYLMTPMEMNQFVDSFQSKHVCVHFDTGNIAMFQHAEHWVPVLGSRIRNVHFKEFNKKGTDYSLETFRPLLDGTTNWPALMDAFAKANYSGYVTFEYFHPYAHYPEALIYQTSDSLNRILGRYQR